MAPTLTDAVSPRLSISMSLREKFDVVDELEVVPRSRYWFGSPCKWSKKCDVLVHIVVPHAIRPVLPRCAHLLEICSTRWDRSWLDHRLPLYVPKIVYIVLAHYLHPDNASTLQPTKRR